VPPSITRHVYVPFRRCDMGCVYSSLSELWERRVHQTNAYTVYKQSAKCFTFLLVLWSLMHKHKIMFLPIMEEWCKELNLNRKTQHQTHSMVACEKSTLTIFLETSQFHGAESFLRSHQSHSYSKSSKHLMESEGSLPCSQKPTTGTVNQMNPVHIITLFLLDSLQ
jgi:hypothetical protein